MQVKYVSSTIALALALLLVQKATAADPNEVFKAQSPITLPNGKKLGQLDISWVDKYARVYLLADDVNASVDMIDLNTNTVTMITPTGTSALAGFPTDPNVPGHNEISGPNGVTTVNHVEIWVGDAPTFSGPIVQSSTPSVAYATDNCDSSAKVISLISQQITDVINVGGCFRSDELAFDETNQVVLIANPSEQDIGKGVSQPFITLISARPVAAGQHHAILKKITFDGTNGTPNATNGIEQPAWSPVTGLFYVSVPQDGPDPTVGAVAVVDGKTLQVVNKYTVSNCAPNGAALGPFNELFLGCSGGPTQIIDITDGSVQGTFPQVTGCDEVYSNPGDNHFLGACGGKLGIIDSDYLSFDQSIAGISHSVAADPVSLKIFAPVAANGALCGASPNLGCIAVVAASVTAVSVTPLNATTSQASIVIDASASTSGSGSLTYLFSVVSGGKVPALLQSPNNPMATVDFVNGPGTYLIQVTVTDANGTSATSSVITLNYTGM